MKHLTSPLPNLNIFGGAMEPIISYRTNVSIVGTIRTEPFISRYNLT
ncbi:MAG: hypothetical protein JXQ90_14045 [Cyclobacteriaceae bacterium]